MNRDTKYVTLAFATMNARQQFTGAAMTTAEKTIQTPNQAKALALGLSAICHNDEIRAILAGALLVQHGRRDGRIEEARVKAVQAALDLAVAHDRQYQD